MVGSTFCLLSDTPEKTPREVGECSEDIGGYFIVQGGERVIISQERMSENVPFVFRNNKVRNKEVEVIDVKSIGPDNEGAPKSMSVKLLHHAKNAIAPEHIVVTCPRIKAEIPLFIMMRALGIKSDREIIELICGQASVTSEASASSAYNMILQECMEDAGAVTTQEKAHEWLAANLGSGGGSRESYSANTLQPNRMPRTTTIREVLAEECLPHIGGASMMFEKACYIAFITKKVLDVFFGKIPHDDRDAYPNKKVELPGNLIGNLFRYLFGTKVIKDMKTSLTKEIHNGFWKSSGKVEDIINPSNIYKILKSTIVTIGMKSSLATGNFVGGKMGTKIGISQVMNRLTYLSGISHLRRLSTPIEKTGKLLAPRKLHNTQYGFVCPAETPEGHAVGVVKNLSSTALVSLPISPEPIVSFLYDVLAMKNLGDVPRALLFEGTRILVNGAWIGILDTDATGAHNAATTLRNAKRSGRIHPHTGITYKTARREIWINTEGGRLIRPVLNAAAVREIAANPACAPPWLSGSASVATAANNWNTVLQWISPKGHSLIEYIDPTETENFYIAMQAADVGPDHTHTEIHPCTMLGTMASNIPFPDHNQAPRNSYQSAMGKQAMGVYALNFRERLDTMSNLLWYSSVPLASPYMSRFYRAQSMPSGFNIVVAIMTYGGYNQEDSIMINRSALDRGLFRSEFYRTYKDEEKKNQASGEEERFCRPNPATTRHMKLANYAKLGPEGIVPENTYVNQDDVLIGKVAPIRLRGADGAAMAGINHAALQAMSSVAAAQAVEAAGGKRFRDSSKLMRTNESGYVDRIYRSRNGEGYSFIKIRVREERIPVIGDKFSSRHGQKGTCGLILAPEDMPQTASGIIPDIIINPHCLAEDHEILTEKGFMSWQEVQHGYNAGTLRVGGYDQESGFLVYEYPTNFILNENKERVMIEFTQEETNISLLVTEDHDMFAKQPNEAYEKCKAESLLNTETFQFTGVSLQDTTCGFSYPTLTTHNVKKTTYLGHTWCVTMPHGFIITRRVVRNTNGEIMNASLPIITGQCIPSRMTIAQLMETLLGRLGCELGFLGDATPFNTAMTAAGLAHELQERGLEPYSNEVLYCGYTGKQMPTNIFMGPCFYQRLKHMVNDKIHSRSTGPLVMLTRQPAEGRARDGGLRFGEMERDVMIAHGASAFLKERMMEASDNFEVHVCKGCGLIGVANKARNIWNCTGCGNNTDFSQVRIPYAYKLFLQELESMNISSRILPETRLRALRDTSR
jgi:DNA-directed RNA polymerase II subunit RPB2